MNRFAKIYETIWTDEKFSKLSADAKLLYIYLASCKDGNSLGLFKVTLGTIQDDFGADSEDEEVYSRSKIKELLKELEDSSLIRYKDKWIMFNKWLRWNPPQGSLMAKRLASNLGEVLMQNPPKELLAYFLATVRAALVDLEGSNKDGSKFNYYEIFKKAFPVNAAAEVLGGVENVKECLLGNAEKVLSKASEKTASERRSNGVQSAFCKEKEKDKEKKKESKKEKDTLSCTSNSEIPKFSVLCVADRTGVVDPSVVNLEMEKNPGIDWLVFRAKFQAYSLINPAPDPDNLTGYFLDYLKIFIKENKRNGK